ncbi:MAG: xylulose kinase, partial [Deltaproteobacteria bacterium]|nr:xylulose kinase [Deltaproteobacteria bacterium]
MANLSLGLDFSTQSLTAVLLDIDSGETIYTHSLDYTLDKRLKGSGLRDDFIVPPRIAGEADQPPELFFKALDAILSDLKQAEIKLAEVRVINNSSQQHGHVYLSGEAPGIFSRLNKKTFTEQNDLADLMAGSLAYGTAPIWRTSNTADQAGAVRDRVGGTERMIRLSGSNSPLRFTGAVVRRVAEQFPKAYRDTYKIHLISSLITGILSGNSDAPIDFGNACGMSLMNYRRKTWSADLIKATAHGLPGGERALRNKLPGLGPPDLIVGTIAEYFVAKYDFEPGCK